MSSGAESGAAEGEIIEMNSKVEGTAEVEHTDTNAYSDWVTNILPGGQELIVVTRSPNGNLINSSTYRSNASGTLTEVEDTAQVLSVLQSVSKKRKGSKNEDDTVKNKRWYRQRFCESWLSDDRFRDWISRVNQDVYKAYCRVCKVELRAGCSELLKHMKTKYHLDMQCRENQPKELCYVVEQMSEDQAVQYEPPEDFLVSDQEAPRRQVPQEPPIPVAAPPRNLMPMSKPRLQIMKPSPHFKAQALLDGEVKEISSSLFCGKYLYLSFYANDFDEYSVSFLQDLISHQAEFTKLSCVLLAASTDSVVTHKAWVSSISDHSTKIPIGLVADFNKSIAKSFNVYDEQSGCAFPSMFLIDTKGRLRYMTVGDFGVPLCLETALRVLRIIVQKKDTTDMS